MVAGLEDISSGTIRIGERVVNYVASRDRDIAMVFQSYALYPHLSIYENIIRAADPAALSAWYRECLGLDADENGLWRQEEGVTVFAAFESETDYFGSRAQRTMLNFRVSDLDAMLAQLRAKGADVAHEPWDLDGVGRFGWVTDPEGNRIELWQPA